MERNHIKKSRFSRKRGPRKGLQSRGANYHLAPYSGPIRSPPMPTELSVALRYTDTLSYTLAASTNFAYGMLEFLSFRPLYTDQLYSLYRYCKVTAVDVQIEVNNTGSTAMQYAMGYVPQLAASTMSYARLTERAGTVHKNVSAKGGMDRAIISKTFGVEKCLGEPVLSKYWVSNSQSLSTSPIDVNEPVISVALQNLEGSVFSAAVALRITYHCQFFSLETPGLS
jgi:hypothetical protein